MIYVLFIILLIHDIIVTSKLKVKDRQLMALRNSLKATQIIIDNQKRK